MSIGFEAGLARSWRLVAVAATIACVAAEGRPPAFVGDPGTAKPDGCAVETHLAASSAPFAVQEIGTISAVASDDEQCLSYLVRHEACRLGGDVLFALQKGPWSLGAGNPSLRWCSGRLARKVTAR